MPNPQQSHTRRRNGFHQDDADQEATATTASHVGGHEYHQLAWSHRDEDPSFVSYVGSLVPAFSSYSSTPTTASFLGHHAGVGPTGGAQVSLRMYQHANNAAYPGQGQAEWTTSQASSLAGAYHHDRSLLTSMSNHQLGGTGLRTSDHRQALHHDSLPPMGSFISSTGLNYSQYQTVDDDGNHTRDRRRWSVQPHQGSQGDRSDWEMETEQRERSSSVEDLNNNIASDEENDEDKKRSVHDYLSQTDRPWSSEARRRRPHRGGHH
ncbi:hypothetical protein F5Y16DRAFT_403264 [Xylariaceae sp. FL0255]|nr:hypothetical protein F5Y16DRAFT_403264 [Xylariaceae sp. FL0255]